MTEIVASLNDPTHQGGRLDAALLSDLQAAANEWAADIAGNATLTVTLGFGQLPPPTLAEGSFAAHGTTLQGVNGLPLEDPDALYEVVTGAAGVPGASADMTVTVNTTNLPLLSLAQSGGVPAGEYDATSVFRHELMHGLGMGGWISAADGSRLAPFESPYDQYVRIGPDGSAYFTGPDAEAVNGGPVALTTVPNGEQYYHLANSHSDPNGTDLMNGIGALPGTAAAISVLDLAILADCGYALTPAALARIDGAPTVVTLPAGAGVQDLAAGPFTEVVVAQGAAAVTGNASRLSSLTLFAAGSVACTDGGGAAIVVATGPGAMTLVGGAQGASLLAFAGDDAVTYAGGAGADEVILGAGAFSGTGGSGSLVLFGGSGGLAYTAGTGSDTLVGGTGSATVHAGAGGYFAGTGGSVIAAMGAGTFMAGNVSGDVLNAASTGGDILAAGGGNETLNGAGAAAGDILFGGSGADQVSLGRGADTVVAGAGTATVQAGAGSAALYLGGPGGGGGATLLSLAAGTAGGSDTVSGFRVGTDHLHLSGYAGAPTVTTTGGNTTLALTDGSRVTLLGVSASGTSGLMG